MTNETSDIGQSVADKSRSVRVPGITAGAGQRRRSDRTVAATGTGKTVIAAFDYARQAPAAPPRLLYLAHRVETVEQARDTFREVMLDGGFGELIAGGATVARGDHVFATIQSVAATRRESSGKIRGAARFWAMTRSPRPDRGAWT